MAMIEAYSFGSMTVGGRNYTSDIIVYPDHVQNNWWRKNGHGLCMEDIADVVARKPEFLVVGCGQSGIMKVPGVVRKELEEKGIIVADSPTDTAVGDYNRLVEEGKNVVGAFHLTC